MAAECLLSMRSNLGPVSSAEMSRRELGKSSEKRAVGFKDEGAIHQGMQKFLVAGKDRIFS